MRRPPSPARKQEAGQGIGTSEKQRAHLSGYGLKHSRGRRRRLRRGRRRDHHTVRELYPPMPARAHYDVSVAGRAHATTRLAAAAAAAAAEDVRTRRTLQTDQSKLLRPEKPASQTIPLGQLPWFLVVISHKVSFWYLGCGDY